MNDILKIISKENYIDLLKQKIWTWDYYFSYDFVCQFLRPSFATLKEYFGIIISHSHKFDTIIDKRILDITSGILTKRRDDLLGHLFELLWESGYIKNYSYLWWDWTRDAQFHHPNYTVKTFGDLYASDNAKYVEINYWLNSEKSKHIKKICFIDMYWLFLWVWDWEISLSATSFNEWLYFWEWVFLYSDPQWNLWWLDLSDPLSEPVLQKWKKHLLTYLELGRICSLAHLKKINFSEIDKELLLINDPRLLEKYPFLDTSKLNNNFSNNEWKTFREFLSSIGKPQKNLKDKDKLTRNQWETIIFKHEPMYFSHGSTENVRRLINPQIEKEN